MSDKPAGKGLACIFCDNPLKPETRKQHIIQESVGGTLWTRATTCDSCNDHFARTVDVVVSNKYSQCMNALAWALKAEAPALDGMKKGSGDRVRMEPGMVPKPGASVTFTPKGGVTIKAKDTEQALKLLKTTGKGKDKTPTVTYGLDGTGGVVTRRSRLIDEDELRSAKKSAIEFLVHKVPEIRAELALNDEFKYIRQGAIVPEIRPVILPEFPMKEMLAAGFKDEPFAHRIWLQCGKGAIDGIVALFSAVAYRFQIRAYSGPERAVLYQKNILKNSGEDFTRIGDGQTVLPPLVEWGSTEEVLKRESARMRKLYIDACWYVEMKCPNENTQFYWQEVRAGTSPGQKLDVPYNRLVDIMAKRVEKVFFGALRTRGPIEESKKIFNRLRRDEIFKDESVDLPSERIREAISKLHLEVDELHRKYVGEPDFGYENYGFTVDGPAA